MIRFPLPWPVTVIVATPEDGRKPERTVPGHTVPAAPFTPAWREFQLVAALEVKKKKLRVANGPIGPPRMRVSTTRHGVIGVNT